MKQKKSDHRFNLKRIISLTFGILLPLFGSISSLACPSFIKVDGETIDVSSLKKPGDSLTSHNGAVATFKDYYTVHNCVVGYNIEVIPVHKTKSIHMVLDASDWYNEQTKTCEARHTIAGHGLVGCNISGNIGQ